MRKIKRICSLSTMVFQPSWSCSVAGPSQSRILKLTMVNQCCFIHQLTGRERTLEDSILCRKRKNHLIDFRSSFFMFTKNIMSLNDNGDEDVTTHSKTSSKILQIGALKKEVKKRTMKTDCNAEENNSTHSKTLRINHANGINKQKIVHQVVDTHDAIQGALNELRDAARTTQMQDPSDPVFAIDCEGVKLSRNGSLALITISTPTKVFIFDVLRLDHSLFDEGLRELLENPSLWKLTFDCRRDSDALWHLYKVKLDGVLDIQLLDAMRRVNNPWKVLPLKRYSEFLLFSKQFAGMKQKDKEVWRLCEHRPLPPELVDYCIADTKPMFTIYKLLKKKMNDPDWFLTLQKASQIYSDYYRSLDVFTSTSMGYDDNGFLLIPMLMFLRGEAEGLASAETEGVERCIGCHRYVLEKYMELTGCYCLVCQEILRVKVKRET